jgi:hypothetical protein
VAITTLFAKMIGLLFLYGRRRINGEDNAVSFNISKHKKTRWFSTNGRYLQRNRREMT